MYFIKYLLISMAVLWTVSSHATNGYFMVGYGAKSIGTAGAGVAYAQDTLAGAVNPAGMAYIEDGFDVGMRFIQFERKGSIDCRGIGACDAVIKDQSSREVFYAPNFGYRRALNDQWSAGVSVYANGGINSVYGRNFYTETIARITGEGPGDPGFPGTGKLGVDFSQLFIAPSLAWRPQSRFAIGISPLFAVQRFSTRGFEVFRPLSADPSSVTGRSTEYMLGGGVRIGGVVSLFDGFRLGGQYTSPIWFKRSTKYNGLLANNGKFNAPPHWTVGLSWNPIQSLTVMFDFRRILFDSSEPVSNPGPTAAELSGVISSDRLLGAGDGIGFGWRNQSIFNLGVIYRFNEKLTFRAGYNFSATQIPNRETLINFVSPATINDNAALGFSWNFGAVGELTMSYQRAFKNSISDRRTALFGASARASILQNLLDVSWARRF